MSRMRILLAMILCMSLLTFAGCGGNDTTDMNNDNGTVTEDGSVVDDLEKGAEDAIDDLEKDAKDAADDMGNAMDGDNGEGGSNKKDTKESTVGQ